MAINISSKLENWISQSESYQTFIDFDKSEENIAEYTIIPRYDDFYISLFSLTFKFIKEIENEYDSKILISLARAFDTFVYNDRVNFQGINFIDSLLYSASLRLLAGYSSTSTLISKRLQIADFDDDTINQLLLLILKKELYANEYSANLINFINNGDVSELDELKQIISDKQSESIDSNPHLYISCTITKAVLNYFDENNLWKILLAIDNDNNLWRSYVNYNFNNNIWYYFPSQLEAIKKGIINSHESFSMQMPTSSGKTALCEIIIYYHFKKHPSSKIILLAPFRALASELKITMGVRLSPYGINVKSLYGGSVPTQEEKISLDNANLLIITPEKMMAIEDVFPEVLNNINLVICDEGHLLDDTNRGFDYELFLTRIKILREKDIRFIYLSAIIPNINEINDWLGGSKDSVAYSDFKPTDFDYAIVKNYSIKGNKYNYYLDFNPYSKKPKNYQLYGYIYQKDYQFRNPNTGRLNTYNFYSGKKTFSVACALKSLATGLVALFAPTKKSNGVAGLCEELNNQIKLINNFNLKVNIPLNYSDSTHLKLLEEYFSLIFSEDYLLVKCIKNGFVFHHGSLPQYIRELIEISIREEKIKLVVCTNTLAEGVNLPLKTLVIHTLKRQFNNRWESLRIRDIKNLIGRVGRAGKEKNGFVIVPHEDDISFIKDAVENINLEPVKGFLYRILEIITRNLSRIRLELTNELIEKQDEEFLRLIDSIDSAILDLVGDDIDISVLDEISNVLVENTFSFIQSNDEQKSVLKKLIKLRSDKIKENVNEATLRKVKKSGSNLRIYLEILEKVNFNDEIWFENINPLNIRWVDFIFEQISKLNYIKHEIESDEYKDILTFEKLKAITRLWLTGNNYGDISKETNIEIENVLNIINDFIIFKMSNITSKVIRLREQFLEDDQKLYEDIIDWPTFLQHGVNERNKLLLIQLGFTERIGLWNLADVINSLEHKSFTEEDLLKSFIISNKDYILKEVINLIPKISYFEIVKNIDYIEKVKW